MAIIIPRGDDLIDPEDLEGLQQYALTGLNTSKDFKLQNIVSLDAGCLVIDQLNKIFNETLSNHPRKEEVRQIFQTTKQNFENLLKTQANELKNADKRTQTSKNKEGISVLNFYKKWRQKKQLDKKINRELTIALNKALKKVENDPEIDIDKIKSEIGIGADISTEQAIKTHFSALRAISTSDLNRSNKVFRSKFTIAIGNRKEEFTDEIHRVEAAEFLLQQTRNRQKELSNQLLDNLTKGKDSKEIVKELNNLKPQEKLYAQQVEDDVWRTSMEANAGVKDKGYLSTNAWIEQISSSSNSSDFKGFQIARSGAFTQSTGLDTNIREMIELSKKNPQDKDLKQQIEDRRLAIQSQFGAVFSEHLVSLLSQNPDLSFFRFTNTIPYSQTSLLHFTGREKNMVEDMKWYFEDFQTKKVIFDGITGFDNEGNLHVSTLIQDRETGKPLELTPKPNLYNFNVQGDIFKKEEKTFQNDLNNEAWSQTKERFESYKEWLQTLEGPEPSPEYTKRITYMEKLKTNIETQIKEGASDYEIATDLIEFEKAMGTPIGINCKSGKDRTSYLVNLVQMRFLNKYIDTQSISLKEKNKAKKEAESSILKQGAGLIITGLNTGFKGYKITKFFVKGLRIDERLKLYFIAAQLR